MRFDVHQRIIRGLPYVSNFSADGAAVMKPDKFEEIAVAAELGTVGDPDLVKALLEALHAAFPAAGNAQVDASVLVSADAALALVARVLTGWEIDLRNTAAGSGKWTCALREGTVRDDDHLIGIGKSDSLPLAVVSALLLVVARRARGVI
jgi:hypothetical protein